MCIRDSHKRSVRLKRNRFPQQEAVPNQQFILSREIFLFGDFEGAAHSFRGENLKEEYAAFWTAYQQDRDLLRFHYHKPREIWENLKDLDLQMCIRDRDYTLYDAASMKELDGGQLDMPALSWTRHRKGCSRCV